MDNRILIVEDDADIAEIIATNLRYSGYVYVAIDDGEKAAAHIAEDDAFDLAILDIMLPGLDGFALCQKMQQHHISVLFLTAKADVLSKITSLRIGAEDYIVKPFEGLELLVRIEKILERTGKLNKVLRYKDIVIDEQSRTMTKSSAAVALQPIEYDLMVVFIRHKNCTMSRERLFTEIWGLAPLGATRTVDTHISNLRRKLHLAGALVSVPKIGYRLEAK